MFDIDKVLADYGLTHENYEQLLKDCENKVGKVSDLDWDQILVNYGIDWNPDTARKAQQPPLLGAAFVKQYYDEKYAQDSTTMSEDEYFKKLRLEKQEIRKEKQKLFDERSELTRSLRNEARKESYADMVKRIICEDVTPMNVTVHYTLFNSNCDLLCHLTDIHTGIEIDNWKNVFNQDVLQQRITKYTSDIIDIQEQHQSENCYMVIGEIVSGIIHNNLRLQNNMDLMEQFKYVSELISAMLIRLANHFNHIYVFVTPGNHSRISPKKDEALDGENMDVLLPFYLEARLQNIENIDICENNVDPEIAMFNIRGNHIIAAHGHKDSPASVVQNMTMLFGVKPNIVLLGHRHTNAMETVYDTKVIQSGCVSGTDAYAMGIRKANRPEQTVSVINDNGLLCLYDIKLD